MPKYYPNTRFSDCWSSVGNITFYHRDGKCYYRTKPHPTFPGTAGQLVQASIHKRALEAWRNISHEEQLEWNALATQVRSKRPPYGVKNHISGYNLFVSAYHGFACIGDEKIPEPIPVPVFPTISLKLIDATTINENIQIRFQIHPTLQNLSRYTLVGKIQLEESGIGSNPGKMRNHLTIIDAHNIATFTVTPPVTKSESLSLHMRYFLIDNTSGHRNKPTKHSEILTIKQGQSSVYNS